MVYHFHYPNRWEKRKKISCSEKIEKQHHVIFLTIMGKLGNPHPHPYPPTPPAPFFKKKNCIIKSDTNKSKNVSFHDSSHVLFFSSYRCSMYWSLIIFKFMSRKALFWRKHSLPRIFTLSELELKISDKEKSSLIYCTTSLEDDSSHMLLIVS